MRGNNPFAEELLMNGWAVDAYFGEITLNYAA
jgi:hypothetical protein